MRNPVVELRWWAGCPSTEPAKSQLREILDDLGLAEVQIRMSEVENDEQARASRFAGSPTILIDGRDVVPAGPEDPIGLTCRIYRRRDGRISPTPDPDDVRDALRRVLAHQEVDQ